MFIILTHTITNNLTTFSFLCWSTSVQSNVWNCVYLWLINVVIFLGQSVFGYLLKCMLNIYCFFCTCFKVRDVVF